MTRHDQVGTQFPFSALKWNKFYYREIYQMDLWILNIFTRKIRFPKRNGEYIFHTYFGGEFRSESVEGIIDQLYEDSRKGIPNLEFEDWWAYQQSVWREKYGIRVPDSKKPHANEKLLEVLLRIGALEVGPLPRAGE